MCELSQTAKEIIMIRTILAMLSQGYPVTKEDEYEIEKSLTNPEIFKTQLKQLYKNINKEVNKCLRHF